MCVLRCVSCASDDYHWLSSSLTGKKIMFILRLISFNQTRSPTLITRFPPLLSLSLREMEMRSLPDRIRLAGGSGTFVFFPLLSRKWNREYGTCSPHAERHLPRKTGHGRTCGCTQEHLPKRSIGSLVRLWSQTSKLQHVMLDVCIYSIKRHRHETDGHLNTNNSAGGIHLFAQ